LAISCEQIGVPRVARAAQSTASDHVAFPFRSEERRLE
jgi:hypothetical protein